MSSSIAITNSIVKCEIARNMPLWIFTHASVFPPAVNSTFSFSMALVMKFMIKSLIFYIFGHCNYYYHCCCCCYYCMTEMVVRNHINVRKSLVIDENVWLVGWFLCLMAYKPWKCLIKHNCFQRNDNNCYINVIKCD